MFSASRLRYIAAWTLGSVIVVGGITLVIANALAVDQVWLAAGATSAVAGLMSLNLARAISVRPSCSRCRSWKEGHSIGSIERDVQAAKEALEAGDLAALGALSPEGETIHISMAVCPRCGRESPIDVSFWHRPSSTPLSIVTYPGTAMPAFERLCKKAV